MGNQLVPNRSLRAVLIRGASSLVWLCCCVLSCLPLDCFARSLLIVCVLRFAFLRSSSVCVALEIKEYHTRDKIAETGKKRRKEKEEAEKGYVWRDGQAKKSKLVWRHREGKDSKDTRITNHSIILLSRSHEAATAERHKERLGINSTKPRKKYLHFHPEHVFRLDNTSTRHEKNVFIPEFVTDTPCLVQFDEGRKS